MRRFAAGALTLLAAVAARASEPGIQRFQLVNRAPFNAILGVPSGWTDPTGPPAELSWDIASHALAQQGGDEQLLLDGETHVLTLRLQHVLGKRWSVGMEVPWITHSGGFMDHAIDTWHDTFGLSEGIRPKLPSGDLQYTYFRGGATEFTLDHYAAGFGDLRTSTALRLVSAGDAGAGTGESPLTVDVTADIEWPLGDARDLTGSGGTDVSAGVRLAGPVARTARLGWAVSAGLTWPGEVDLPLPEPAGQIYYVDASLAWAALDSLDLILQAQGQSGSYQSALRMLGSTALQFGAGADWRFSRQFCLRIGVFEDIRSDTAPDFATQLTLVFRPGR